MFFSDAGDEEDGVEVVMPSWRTTLTIAVALVTTVGLGVLPNLLLPAASMAAEFLR